MMKLKKYNPSEIETKYQKAWLENNTYAYKPGLSKENNFIIDTAPPTISGSLHIGHVFSYTQTDVLARFQRMLGKNVFYPMGWDDNGLPTEKRIQTLYGIYCDPMKNYEKNLVVEKQTKKVPLRPVSRKNFLEICHQQVLEDEKKYKKLWSHIALSVDWNQTYETIGAHSQKISQKSFLDLYEKNLIENRFTPVSWDVNFQTAIAQADIEDRERQGFYHDIRFEVKGGGQFTISTTRPELLAACVAVTAHPEDDRYKKFFSKTAITPLFGAEVPIIPSSHADPEKGTGILMICTFGDMEDVHFWQKHSLPLKQILTSQGRLKEISFQEEIFKSVDSEKAKKYYATLCGLKVLKARTQIVDLLKEENVLVGEPKATTQFVKYYEKGDQALELIPTRQWFIKILDYKQELIEYGKKVIWHPPSFYKRYEQWVENLNQDWCISRQRFFGVPFPIWYPIHSNSEIDYKNVLLASQLPTDPMKTAPKGYKEEQRDKANGFTATPDVMDTWATSSLTPFISSHWVYDLKRHNELFPADLRPQAHEIIRTWAFYTIVKSYFHTKCPPWKNIAISGWVVDPNRSKMSKSKGNIITPEQTIKNYSADAVRYWATKSRLGQDTVYEERMFKTGQRLTTKIFNAAKFVNLQVEDQKFSISYLKNNINSITEPVDQSWLVKLEVLVEQASSHLKNFEYSLSLDLIEKTFWIFCDNYLELIKSRTYQLKDKPEGLSGLLSLDYSLYLFLKLFAPYLPYITEEVWSWRYKEEQNSIHNSKWPTPLISDKKFTSKETIELAFSILELIRNEKSSQQKSLATEVKTISITIPSNKIKLFQFCKQDILKAGHIPEKALTILESKDKEESYKISLTL